LYCEQVKKIRRVLSYLPIQPPSIAATYAHRRDAIPDHSSNEYLALADELEKLEAEALADDDEHVPY
jgi:hypothetical protein